MPGWHARTQDLAASGELAVMGIAPEQYPDRMKLFLKWQEMPFPVLMDPLNVMEVTSVATTLLVDRQGIIRYRNPKPKDLATFLKTNYGKEAAPDRKMKFAAHTQLALDAIENDSETEIDEAIVAYQAHLKNKPEDATSHFQLGVLLRHRYDSASRQADDFQTAIDSWAAALALNPGQYIWRRRIQQFGPRLDKPYPFYDWMDTATEAITARGEIAPPVRVAPTLSELAQPRRKATEQARTQPYPDPNNALSNDEQMLAVEMTLVPHTNAKKSTLRRAHLQLSPQGDAHWSSDAQEVSLWLIPTEGDPIELASETSLLPEEAETSTRPRLLEAEFELPEGDYQLALFYFLCREENAACLFLKKEWLVSNTQTGK